VEQAIRYEEVQVPLRETVHGIKAISAVIGIPEWWPTGSRVAVAIAHDSTGDMNDPLIVRLHRELTERKVMSLRFNFPFAEAGKRASSDSPETLERVYRSALAILGRDPGAAPAHLFLGGKGLGAGVAARLSAAQLQIDGTFLLGFPLHPQDRPEKPQADILYRIISPLLFVQGTRDRRCHLDGLRQCIARVGTPTVLHVVQDADQSLRVSKKYGRDEESVETEIVQVVASWMESRLQGR